MSSNKLSFISAAILVAAIWICSQYNIDYSRLMSLNSNHITISGDTVVINRGILGKSADITLVKDFKWYLIMDSIRIELDDVEVIKNLEGITVRYLLNEKIYELTESNNKE